MSFFYRSLLLSTVFVALSEALPVFIETSNSLYTRTVPNTLLQDPAKAEAIGWVYSPRDFTRLSIEAEEISVLMPSPIKGKPRLVIVDDPKEVPLPNSSPYICLVFTKDWLKWRDASKYFVDYKILDAFANNDEVVRFYLYPGKTVGIAEIPKAMLTALDIRFQCYKVEGKVKGKVEVEDVVSAIPKDRHTLFGLSYDILGRGADLKGRWKILQPVEPPPQILILASDLKSTPNDAKQAIVIGNPNVRQQKNPEPVTETSPNSDDTSSSNSGASSSSNSGASSSNSGASSSNSGASSSTGQTRDRSGAISRKDKK